MSSLPLFVALVLPPASAEDGTGIDMVENIFGATNVQAVTGHGGLTLGVSREGDITVLAWPDASVNDQLGYLSSNDLDARSQDRMGAPEGAGVFSGLRLETGDGIEVTWFRDADTWTTTVDYGPGGGSEGDEGANPHTVHVSEALGLEVEVVDAVSPDVDLWVREVSVTREGDSPVSAASLFTYANLSPLPPSHKVAELPFTDQAMDGRNDYAAIWDEATAAVVHFHPEDERVFDSYLDFLFAPGADWGSVGEAMAEGDVDGERLEELVAGLDGEYGAGAWLALSSSPAPEQVQVGLDGTDWCGAVDALIDNIQALPDQFEAVDLPLDSDLLDQLRCGSVDPVYEEEGWTWLPEDPLQDAADGELSQSGLAAGEVASALRTPLTFEPLSLKRGGGEDEARAWILLGAGETLAAAQEALSFGLADPGAVPEDAEEALSSWLSGMRIPGEEGTRTWEVARRSLVNLRLAMEPDTGALVASPARQPPYNLDWPRDGAFFNLALDAAGASEWVELRNRTYMDWQRTEPVEPTPYIDPDPPEDPDEGNTGTYPAWAWEMNYFPDGTPGGNYRFEIDTTALAVWTLVAHVGWAEDPQAHLEEVWSSVREGTELLARWRDPETGLHAPAQEDDQAEYTQTLHGAITVFAALDMASRAARYLGEDDLAESWIARATELREAIDTELVDPETGLWYQDASGRAPYVASGRVPTGPTAWLVWPCTLYDPSDSRMREMALANLETVTPTIELEDDGGAYFLKTLLATAVAYPDDDEIAPTTASLLEQVAEQATDTHHFGEVMINQDGEPEQRTANPHIWEGALFYLAALAVEDPDALQPWETVLPASELVVPRGCGCGHAGPGGGLVFLAGVLALVRRGRGGQVGTITISLKCGKVVG